VDGIIHFLTYAIHSRGSDQHATRVYEISSTLENGILIGGHALQEAESLYVSVNSAS
jgi:hypothetical protein